ncbi:MAG TPA: DoxX family protein [Vicinamibacterales bacterium]|nr:DoxX family protein [Vicinamibacterales bacterium]
MKLNRALWAVQGLLAALFLFAGAMKLILPVEAMQNGPTALPGWFLRFIGTAEIAGAIGLVLPGLLKIKTQLTPLAAGGLTIIMAGAVVLTAEIAIAHASVPFLVGLVLLAVAYGRVRLAPIAVRQRTRRPSQVAVARKAA